MSNTYQDRWIWQNKSWHFYRFLGISWHFQQTWLEHFRTVAERDGKDEIWTLQRSRSPSYCTGEQTCLILIKQTRRTPITSKYYSMIQLEDSTAQHIPTSRIPIWSCDEDGKVGNSLWETGYHLERPRSGWAGCPSQEISRHDVEIRKFWSSQRPQNRIRKTMEDHKDQASLVFFRRIRCRDSVLECWTWFPSLGSKGRTLDNEPLGAQKGSAALFKSSKKVYSVATAMVLRIKQILGSADVFVAHGDMGLVKICLKICFCALQMRSWWWWPFWSLLSQLLGLTQA